MTSKRYTEEFKKGRGCLISLVSVELVPYVKNTCSKYWIYRRHAQCHCRLDLNGRCVNDYWETTVREAKYSKIWRGERWDPAGAGSGSHRKRRAGTSEILQLHFCCDTYTGIPTMNCDVWSIPRNALVILGRKCQAKAEIYIIEVMNGKMAKLLSKIKLLNENVWVSASNLFLSSSLDGLG